MSDAPTSVKITGATEAWGVATLEIHGQPVNYVEGSLKIKYDDESTPLVSVTLIPATLEVRDGIDGPQ